MIVDDHKLVRESWQLLFNKNRSFNVIALCENGYQAIEQAEILKPDIILMDINMSPLNGFEVTERILKNNPAIKIIGLSANNQPRYASRLMKLGAMGYLTKTSLIEEINYGIMEVYHGRKYICQEVKKQLPPDETNPIN